MKTLAALLFLSLVGALAAQSNQRPNVVFIITDDQGYGDLGAHGNTMIRTPNLDRLANESVRLTNYHVDPTCAPTRSALMSGRYSTRTGVWHTIMGRSLMASDEETLAEVFKAGGYRTGMFGKWHLGDNYPCRPQDQGFDRVVWHHGGGVGQGPDFWGNDYFDDTYEADGSYQPFEGYCTDVWFREATKFIEEKSDRPFFAYVSTNAPHGPYLVAEKYQKPYRDRGVPKTMASFYGMITNIDENVGRLRARLEELEIGRDTIFVFTTDNGTAAGRNPRKNEPGSWRGFNAMMRGQKGSEYDGGHRVPFFVHWPAAKVGGGGEIPLLAAHIDVLPTLLEMTGLKRLGEKPLDGVSFAAALLGRGKAPANRTLFVHSQRIERPKKWRKCAVMTDRWRLVNGKELCDLPADRGQRTDVAAQHTEVVARLRRAYDGWWKSLTPVYEQYVRIGVGGRENPAELMSHDWHTGSGRTPWHQNHVREGAICNGPWAIEVERDGKYEITLRRWPKHLARKGGFIKAGIHVQGQRLSEVIEQPAMTATFTIELKRGPTMLLTTLQRPDGKVHGAYYASVRFVE